MFGKLMSISDDLMARYTKSSCARSYRVAMTSYGG